MGGENTAVCSACGEKLGDPSEEVSHPDDDNPPENAHFTVQVRSDGAERAQCSNTGQLASVQVGNRKISPLTGEETGRVEESPAGEGEGSVGEPTAEQRKGVFDFPEQKSQYDILEEVISNPRYELDDDQIQEVMDWADDYNGQMPPDVLQNLLSNMGGIQKQTAQLLREKYELKLNNWVRKQSQQDDGPPIGALSGRAGGHPGSSPRPSGPSPNPQPNKNSGNQNQTDPEPQKHEPTSRVNRRQGRRQEALDRMADEFAVKAAQNMAEDFGSFFTEGREFFFTLMRNKAESDPDWFFEKAEDWDMSLVDEFMSESEAKQQRESGGGKPQMSVDSELDSVMEKVGGDSQTESNQPTRERTNTYTPEHDTGATQNRQDHTNTQNEQDESEEELPEGDDGFEEIFGDESEAEEPNEVN